MREVLQRLATLEAMAKVSENQNKEILKGVGNLTDDANERAVLDERVKTRVEEHGTRLSSVEVAIRKQEKVESERRGAWRVMTIFGAIGAGLVELIRWFFSTHTK